MMFRVLIDMNEWATSRSLPRSFLFNSTPNQAMPTVSKILLIDHNLVKFCQAIWQPSCESFPHLQEPIKAWQLKFNTQNHAWHRKKSNRQPTSTNLSHLVLCRVVFHARFVVARDIPLCCLLLVSRKKGLKRQNDRNDLDVRILHPKLGSRCFRSFCWWKSASIFVLKLFFSLMEPFFTLLQAWLFYNSERAPERPDQVWSGRGEKRLKGLGRQ